VGFVVVVCVGLVESVSEVLRGGSLSCVKLPLWGPVSWGCNSREFEICVFVFHGFLGGAEWWGMGCWVSMFFFVNWCDCFGLRVCAAFVLFHVEHFFPPSFFLNLSGSTPEAEPKTRLICGVNWVLGLIA